MFSSGLGPRDPGSPQWGALLESSVAKLLDQEVPPRATSAPPHLDARFGQSGPGPSSGQTWTPIDPTADIRYDEDYARFYEAYSGQRKLPPPVDGRTLYTELGLLHQHHQQQQQAQQRQQAAELQAAAVQHVAMMGSAATPPPHAAAALASLMAGSQSLTPGGLEVIQECRARAHRPRRRRSPRCRGMSTRRRRRRRPRAGTCRWRGRLSTRRPTRRPIRRR
ncbi:MAG: hypothetical protein J3K34DRAFT_203570 [Monoraphidium minutum]|nr:MAG: hypothetical protein J3K34DRAFT_203570 [Monoraphidium minutum]